MYQRQGKQLIVGLDEVGRGCWAGPLVAACYYFKTSLPTNVQIADSKLLTSRRRTELFRLLQDVGVYGIGQVEVQEIDSLGLQQAQYMAYRRALGCLPIQPDIVLLDGRAWKECPYPCQAIIKGDRNVASIAAASIMAKVYRDALMQDVIHPRYPEYGFNIHVGYGTKQHKQALLTQGVCDMHRTSFKPIQSILSRV